MALMAVDASGLPGLVSAAVAAACGWLDAADTTTCLSWLGLAGASSALRESTTLAEPVRTVLAAVPAVAETPPWPAFDVASMGFLVSMGFATAGLTAPGLTPAGAAAGVAAAGLAKAGLDWPFACSSTAATAGREARCAGFGSLAWRRTCAGAAAAFAFGAVILFPIGGPCLRETDPTTLGAALVTRLAGVVPAAAVRRLAAVPADAFMLDLISIIPANAFGASGAPTPHPDGSVPWKCDSLHDRGIYAERRCHRSSGINIARESASVMG